MHCQVYSTKATTKVLGLFGKVWPIAYLASFLNSQSDDKVALTQCGIYGNSLSHIFDKNFVKAKFLLKKLLKSCFHEKISEREFLVFPNCVSDPFIPDNAFLTSFIPKIEFLKQ